MSKGRRILLVMFILLVCLALDQITKLAAATHLPRHRALSFAWDTFRLDYTENRGAVFNFETHLPEPWRGPLVTAGVSSLLALVTILLFTAPCLPSWWVVSLSLITGGAFSNLLDRVAPANTVVDFLSLGWNDLRTPIFNVADVAVTMGLVLLGLSLVRRLVSSCPVR